MRSPAFTRSSRRSRDTKPDEFKLADAQFTIAREYGFTSWPRLVEYFEALDRQHLSGGAGRPLEREPRTVAESLLTRYRSHRPSAMFFATFVPRFYGRSLEAVTAAEVTLDDARLVQARMHRYPSWEDNDSRGREQPPENEWTRSGSPNYRVGRAIRNGDIAEVARLIDEHPHLLEKVPRVGHVVPISVLQGALNYELEARTPESRAVTDYIVSRGGDLRETVSAMLISPGFSRKVGEVEYLLDRGADPEWLPPNGVPVLEHALCRYWNGPAVDAIARRVTPRKAFWIAAGLGDVEAVKQYVSVDGVPTIAARQNRPDYTALMLGPTPFRPDADDTEIIWEGFFAAALNQRYAVVELLLDRGFPIDYVEWGQSILHLAVGNRWVELIELLVRRGASVDLGDWYGHTARELAEVSFAGRPTPEARRIMELCGGRDAEAVSREAAAEREKQTRPSSVFMEALRRARQDALHQGKTAAGLENLFVGLLRGENQLAVIFLNVGGVDLARLKALLGTRLDPSEESVDDIPFDDWASQACMDAQDEAKRHLRTQINPLHLLFVLLRHEEGPVADLIRRSGSEVGKVRQALEREGAM